MWLIVLGRQPELSLAELEARFGAEHVSPLRADMAIVEAESFDINRFGGAISVGKVLGEINAAKLSSLPKQLIEHLAKSEAKQNIGLSVHGDVPAREVGRMALELKKLAKKSGHKIRVVPNNEPVLSSAQVVHNQLTKDDNAEFMVAMAGDKAYVGQTTGVQDIDAYRQRDVERPARDSRVGMLPPKLAQIMLNLARVAPGQTVLDPFCGTGVVLQEALLFGAQAYGSDIAERMVRMSETNLAQLARQYQQINIQNQVHLEVSDARTRRWQPPIDAVVSEIYLGPAFGTAPNQAELNRAVKEVDGLLIDTLKNLAQQLTPDTRVVLAVPRWQNSSGHTALPSLDRLEEFGYTSTRFVHASGDLVYAREDQNVARQLLVLSKV